MPVGNSQAELLTGLLGAELIFRRSSWMLLAIFMSEGCRVKLRLAPGDENSFLAQFSKLARGSSITLFLGGHWDEECWSSEIKIKQREGKNLNKYANETAN